MKQIYFFVIGILFCCLSALAALSPHDQEILNVLEEQFRGIETVKTDFTQEKTLAIFDKPMILKGWIALDHTGRFAWHVQKPLRYALVVSDGIISQWDEDSGKIQKMRLSKNPVLEVVFEQLTRWFSGQYAALADKYMIVILQDKPAVISFTPKPDALEHKVIKQVLISFDDDEKYLKEIAIDEISGDKTKLIFYDTLINQSLPSTTWRINTDAP